MKFPQSAFIAVTYQCHARCLMCDIWRKERRGGLRPEAYRKLPKTLKKIDITGGEPFLKPDLVEIVKVLKQTCPKARLLITTSGLLPQSINQVGPCQDLAFRVSLDAIGEVHDKIRNVPGAFIKALKTINALKKLKVKDLGVIFTLMSLNQDELPRVLNFCQKEGLNFSLNLVHESPIYFGEKKINLRPDARVIEESLQKVRQFFLPSFDPKDWAKAWFYRKLVDYAKTGKRPIRCGAGESFFYLDPFGDVYFCHFKNWKIGNLKKQSFSEIWQGEERKKYLKMAQKCHDCFMVCTTKDEIKKRPFLILR